VDHIFRGKARGCDDPSGFLSTQQQCLHLAHVDGGGPIHKDKDPDLLYCETKDFVQIGLKADVFYKITNPEKVLLIVGEVALPLLRSHKPSGIDHSSDPRDGHSHGHLYPAVDVPVSALTSLEALPSPRSLKISCREVILRLADPLSHLGEAALGPAR
jgi:hypothetical protein